jgi:hypothetical protein
MGNSSQRTNSVSNNDMESIQTIKLTDRLPGTEQQVKVNAIQDKFLPVTNEKDALFTMETSGLTSLDEFRRKKLAIARLEDPTSTASADDPELKRK